MALFRTRTIQEIEGLTPAARNNRRALLQQTQKRIVMWLGVMVLLLTGGFVGAMAFDEFAGLVVLLTSAASVFGGFILANRYHACTVEGEQLTHLAT